MTGIDFNMTLPMCGADDHHTVIDFSMSSCAHRDVESFANIVELRRIRVTDGTPRTKRIKAKRRKAERQQGKNARTQPVNGRPVNMPPPVDTAPLLPAPGEDDEYDYEYDEVEADYSFDSDYANMTQEPLFIGDKVRFATFNGTNLGADAKRQLFANARHRQGMVFTISSADGKNERKQILGGQAIRLQGCRLDGNGTVVCDGKQESDIRILIKHGGDKVPVLNGDLIKLRKPGSSIDCSFDMKSPVNCDTKRSQEYYGFVIFKA